MSDKRSAVTHVYWTDDEKKAVEAHARRQGMPLAIYLRTLALADVGRAIEDAPHIRPKK